MRVLESVANFGESGRDDLELDVAEHVLGLALGRFIERVGHRECRAGASELDEGDGAEFAEPTRQLTYDGGLGRDAERSDRVAAHAGDRVRERLLVDETGAQ